MDPIADDGEGVRTCERDIMKKIAFRIVTVSGGLLAMLVAGGAWVRG
jgi:hypothetical protein